MGIESAVEKLRKFYKEYYDIDFSEELVSVFMPYVKEKTLSKGDILIQIARKSILKNKASMV